MNHDNRIREALDSNGHVLGARTVTQSPTLVELYGNLGLDFAWLDLEHAGISPADGTALLRLVRAADAATVDLLVRLPSGDPPTVRKVLDAGVRTVLIPRVETATEARAAVEAARFSYDGGTGSRGVADGRPSDWGASMDGYAAREDRRTCVGVMLETETAVENLESILDVPELGFAFVGPADLSVSMGHPLERDHPSVEAAITEIRNACLDAGVPVGRIANDAAAVRNALDEGYRLVRLGDEVTATRRVLADRLAAVRTDSG